MARDKRRRLKSGKGESDDLGVGVQPLGVIEILEDALEVEVRVDLVHGARDAEMRIALDLARYRGGKSHALWRQPSLALLLPGGQCLPGG